MVKMGEKLAWISEELVSSMEHMILPCSASLRESYAPAEIHDDHANIVGAPPGQRQLCQQHGRVGARLVGVLLAHTLDNRRSVLGARAGCREGHAVRASGRRRRTVATEARPDDLARHLVGHDVPQAVAGQDQTLVVVGALRHRYLRLRRHKRL
uniref:Uncharacterized protein n=1 Tax=Zea mays TaxID=4577 RepID=C4JA84_MAIZE|nr:unknown [Zea mays]